MMETYAIRRLSELNEKYDPDHDIGPNALVQYQVKVLIDALQDALAEIGRLEDRITELMKGAAQCGTPKTD